MAEVFLARFEWARGLEKTVVVKRILPQWAAEPRFVEMFFSEAQLASQLSHPNIAQIIEFGESGGAYFLAMEYVDGPSLRTLFKAIRARGERMPFGHCARIVASACEALAYAHDLTDSRTGRPLQLVHRDVSPDNILISAAGAVKLADFGIAKAVTQTHHTKTGVVKGKLAYMSPEQVRSEPLDRRADIFALGVVLYELVAGAKPYEARSEIDLIQAIVKKDRIPLSSRRPDTPPELERIVFRAMERDRAQRYSDCRVMHGELEQFLISAGQPVSAFQIAELLERYVPPGHREAPKPEVRARKTPELPAAPPRSFPESFKEEEPTDTHRSEWSEPTRERTAPREARRPPWPLIVAVLAGVAALGGAATLFLGSGSAPPPATATGPRPLATPGAELGAVAASATPPVRPEDVEPRLKAAQVAMDRRDFDQVLDLLEQVRNPDGTRAATVEDLLRRAAEEKENKKDLAMAARQLNAGSCEAAEKTLAGSQGTLSFATEWQATKARLDRQCRKKEAVQPGTARTAAEQARAEEAEKLFEEGKALLKRRQYQDAQGFFAKCLELDRRNAECHLALGSTYARLRTPEKGAQHYREFLRLAPTHDRAPEVSRLLQEYEDQKTRQK